MGARELALVSAPPGGLHPVVQRFAQAWAAAGIHVHPVADLDDASRALAAQPPASVGRLRLLGHGGPGTLELGLGDLHLRRHFLRAASVQRLFTPAAVAALAADARIDLVACRAGQQAPNLLDPAEPDRFDGQALLRAVARACPGREVRAADDPIHQDQVPEPPLPLRWVVSPAGAR